jgi:hypothetical protein
VCDINCDAGSVQCATCAKWVHASCEGFDPDHDLPELSDNYKFVCSVCIRESDKGCHSMKHLRVIAKREKIMIPSFE